MSATASPTASRVTPPTAPSSNGRRRTPLGYLLKPLFLGLVVLVLFLYVRSQDLDSIEARALALPALLSATWEHVQLAAVSTVLVIIIAVPLGVLLTRPFTRRVQPFLIGLFNLGQAVPTIGILVLLAVAFLFVGFKAAIIGLVLYAIVPVLLNTMVGLQQVDEAVLEAGRGMGLSKWQVLRGLELPLSVPIILAGVRTALVINVGTATLAAYINAGGLGEVIVAGLTTNRVTIQITGAVLTAVLALLIDYLAGLAEDLLRPAGL